MFVDCVDFEFFEGEAERVFLGNVVLKSDVDIFNCDLDVVDDLDHHFAEITLLLILLL